MSRRRASRSILDSLLAVTSGANLYSISGVVYDADGSTPVDGATVALGALSAVSAADGTYTITDVPPGTSGSMTCTKTGYLWTAITVAAMSGNLNSQNYTNTWYAGGGSLAACVGAYKFTGVANEAAALVNLVNGALPLVKINNNTWDTTNGWKGVSGAALNTQITEANNTWSHIVKFTNAAASTGILYGYTGALFIWPNVSGGHRYYHGSNNVTVVGGLTSGIMCIAGLKAYLNGAFEGDITTSALTPVVAYLLARNDGMVANEFVDGYAQGLAIYNATLTPTQVAQISAGMGF